MDQLRHEERIQRAHEEIRRTRASVAKAPSRQRYHFMAPQGWLSDPNGLIHFRGRYHYFYQYNPFDAFWGAMHWGHAVSDDLLHWEHLPVALAPSESYDDHSLGGCFSGTAIEHEGKLYLFYTGTANNGNGLEQTQCVAFSGDGVKFEKYAGNPIITAPEGYDPANFRDPKVWKHGDTFYMLVGAKKGDFAQALLFASANLLNWEFVNVLAESRGELGYMWECPDFFPLGDEYVLMFSPMGLGERKTLYLVGEMEYRTGKFNYTTVGEVDWGHHYYAPQSFLDPKGRRIVVAWANGWQWMPWWQDWGPTYQEKWCGWFALPREVKLSDDGTLQFLPIEELNSLRFGEQSLENVQVGTEGLEIQVADPVAYELYLECDLSKSETSGFALHLKADTEHETIIYFDLLKGELCFDRNRSDGWTKGVSRSPLFLKDVDKLDIRVFADTSSLELFVNGGRICHSHNVYAGPWQTKNSITAIDGNLVVRRLVTYGLSRTTD